MRPLSLTSAPWKLRTSSLVDDISKLYAAFSSISTAYRDALEYRYEAQEALAEAFAQARDSEERAHTMRARLSSNLPGKNADERAAALVVILDEDSEYRAVVEDGYRSRAAVNDLQRQIDKLDDQIKGMREHMRMLVAVTGRAAE